MEKTLFDLTPKQSGKVTNINLDKAIKKRFSDFGLIEGTNITSLFSGASGGINAYLIRGVIIALRNEDTKKIFIEVTQVS